MLNALQRLSFLAVALLALGCAVALPAYNEPFTEKLRLDVEAPASYEVAIDGSDLAPSDVPDSGRVLLSFPILPRECSTYMLGVRVRDRSVTNRKLILIYRHGRMVKKLSIEKLRRLAIDPEGYYILRLR